ncbi:hypothetical protein T4E_8160 [Trichinella pseudospiralis]|uniref:Uncharacterized protein n=1 Tax=Trichinella pseudospiralis TaxID=6337 RepID=A0A0V0YM33_TRIPS|nr:hypothetical protein T4E_8160 [Trichinella pseudospiralis]
MPAADHIDQTSHCNQIIFLYIEYLILENAKKTVDELNCQDGGTEIEIKEFY